MAQSNSQSSNQSDSLSRDSSSNMSACDLQRYNNLQLRLDSLSDKIKNAKDRQSRLQLNLDQFELRLPQTQDTDERERIGDRIQMYNMMISHYVTRLSQSYDERRQTRDKLEKIKARANRSRQSNKRLEVITPSFIPSHTILMLYD